MTVQFKYDINSIIVQYLVLSIIVYKSDIIMMYKYIDSLHVIPNRYMINHTSRNRSVSGDRWCPTIPYKMLTVDAPHAKGRERMAGEEKKTKCISPSCKTSLYWLNFCTISTVLYNTYLVPV